MLETKFNFESINHNIIGEVYITDTDWRVYKVDIKITENEIIVRRQQTGNFWMFVEITDERIGGLYLPVWGDNQAGYSSGKYNLFRELLISQETRCQKWDEAVECQEWNNIAEKMRKTITTGDSRACYKLLSDAVTASEELLFKIAQKRNLKRKIKPVISSVLFGERKGNYAIGVGPDWPVDQRPDFIQSDSKIKLAMNVITGTTLPSFWRWIEYERGKYNWEGIDRLVNIALKNNIVIKPISLYWGGMGGTPPWFRGLTYSEQLKAIESWVRTMVNRYKNVVVCWETVNEMHNWRGGNPFSWNHNQILEVTRIVNELVGSLDPGKPRLINNCCIWGDYVQTGRKSLQWADVPWQATWSPLTYLDAVCEAGIEFESIGLQFYNPGRDIATCFQLTEEFAKFGKQLQVTEMGTPSGSKSSGLVETGQVKLGGGWRGVWTRQKQALWVERFFTTFAMNPKVTVMNYWDFDDATSFIADAGLIDKNGNPKPAYNTLLELSEQWKK